MGDQPDLERQEPARPAAVGLAAAASAGAALVHAAAAGSHTGDDGLQLLFSVCAALQLGWAALVLASHRRAVLLVGVVLNGGAVAAWLASRTVGLPIVDSLKDVEAVGLQDSVAALLGALAALGAVACLLPDVVRRSFGAAWVVAGTGAALLLAVPAMAADHAHGSASHAHGHGEGEEAATEAHAHGEGDAAAGTHDHDDASPAVSLDDERLTAEQRATAEDLIDATTTGMTSFADVAGVEAAGYVSIGDAITGFEHFINWDYMDDGRELDAEAIESVVFEVTDDGGREPVSAMYILDEGRTMDDVPEVAGELTVWHDHQNLCWDESGTRVVGLLVREQCRPGGELWVTPPMLHVWMTENPCGPFAGLEGHGGGGDDCGHDHAEGGDGGLAAQLGLGGGDGGGGHDHEVPARLDHEPTDDQLDAARELIDDTTAATARYEDVAAAEAAGFRSIGDGGSGVEHFVHQAWNGDDVSLDPDEPESLVYRVDPDGSRELTTVMYILPPGSTMDDVPDIAGNLTVWHDHDNLCFDDDGRIAGFSVGGRCVPGGELVQTAPMLHVWVKPNDCGPFAGTDARQMTGSCVPDLEL
jgi:hypothetical protein